MIKKEELFITNGCVHDFDFIKRDFGHGLTMWLPECMKCHYKGYHWEWRVEDE